MSTTWILVADRARARLFALSDDDRALREVEDFLNPDGRAAGREIEQDRPPRTFDRVGAGRHAIEPQTTLREKTAHNFARALETVLERGRAGHCYDQLVLIAPPQFLGTLNRVLDEQVRACVAAEVPNDLTMADAQAVLEHLPAHLLPPGLGRRH